MIPDISQYTLNKILLAIGALAGVSIMNVLWQPKFIKRKGIIAAAMITTAIAITLALLTGGAVLIWLGVDPAKTDLVLIVGGGLGALSPFGLNAMRNWFEKYEDKDIMELKDVVQGGKK
jgi:hypothetical protein